MGSDAIRPGDVIGGRYRVRSILSRTRGYLVEAVHSDFDQRVVIRVLPASLCEPKEVKRFQREARILTRLESEHVARLLDIGTLPDGALFFVRPYLDGADLGSYLARRGALPLGEATLLILQAAEAVAESHVHSYVLRELSPAHLFLTQRVGGEPLLKVIDFGTAKLLRDTSGGAGEVTATSMFGLSCYSSPEVVRKQRNLDARTDIWSLGAIFYQMLAGRLPFDGEMAVLMLQICRDMPPALSSLRPDIPSELAQIIGWAMAKEPEGRFANVYGFAHALAPFASAEGQLLIHRIGTMTAAAEQRRRSVPSQGSIPPGDPDSEPPRARKRADGDRDSPTLIRDAESMLKTARASARPSAPAIDAPSAPTAIDELSVPTAIDEPSVPTAIDEPSVPTAIDAPSALAEDAPPPGPAAPAQEAPPEAVQEPAQQGSPEAAPKESPSAVRRSSFTLADQESTKIEQPSAALLSSAATDQESTKVEPSSAVRRSSFTSTDQESTKVGEPPAALLSLATNNRESRTEQRVLIDTRLFPSSPSLPHDDPSRTSVSGAALDAPPQGSLEDSANFARGELTGAAFAAAAESVPPSSIRAAPLSASPPISSREVELVRAPSSASPPSLTGVQPPAAVPGVAPGTAEVTRAAMMIRPPQADAASMRVRARTQEVKLARAVFATALVVLLGALGFAFLRGYSKGDGAALHAPVPSAMASATPAVAALSTPETAPSAAPTEAPSPSAEPVEPSVEHTASPSRPTATTHSPKASSPPNAASPGTTASSAVSATPTASPAATGSSVASSSPAASSAPTAEPATAHPTESATAASPAPASNSSDMGTLIAVAVGGSCAFSVNDASKGTLSTLKVPMKPGTYLVTCRPASGDAQSKSVTVTKGGAAMVTFKIP